ncbi:MAG: PqqD family protein [Anaerolineae bacterium]|jgi:hypothetical protein
MTPFADKAFVPSNAVLAEPLETGLALTRVGGDRVFVLNVTGATIWQLFDGHTTCHQIASVLAQRFTMPIEQLEQEVRGFIARLAAAGLIKEQDTDHNN